MQHREVFLAARCLTLAVGLGASMGAAVADENLPLYLTLSQSITQDSNVLRYNVDKRKDTIANTTVNAGLNKAYGRQRYQVNGSASKINYRNNETFDHDAFNVNAEIGSEVGSKVYVTLSGGASQFLPSFEDQDSRDRKNTERTKDASLDVRYGLYGRWSVNGGVSYREAEYAVTNDDNRTTSAVFAGLRYLPTDLAYIGLTLYRGDTEMPYSTPEVGEELERTSLSLDTVWQVTGYSRLSARVSATQERYQKDPRRNFNGLTGTASWQYTPGGKVSYSLNWVRDTNNAGGSTLGYFNGVSVYATNKRLTNQINLGAVWSATSKIKVNAGLTYALFDESWQLNTNTNTNDQDGRYHAINVGATYQPIQSVGLGCDWQKYDRTSLEVSRVYDGQSVTCRASFTLD